MTKNKKQKIMDKGQEAKRVRCLMSYVLCLVTYLLAAGTASAQTAASIQHDPSYIWAEGTGETMRVADNIALQDLMSQISTTISAESAMDIWNNQGEQETAKSGINFNQVIKTYSAATLTNTQRLITDEKRDKDGMLTSITVMRFVKKSELDRIFESRLRKAQDFTRIAHKNLDRLQMGEALRYYYWALTLVQSLRYPAEAQVPDKHGDMQIATTYLTRCIEHILDNITTTVIRQDDKTTYTVAFKYKDHPVAQVEYTYFDGMDWSSPVSVVDGEGLLELRPGFVADNVRIRYEYMYLEEMQADREVKSVMESVQPYKFNKGDKRVSIKEANLAFRQESAASTPEKPAPVEVESASAQSASNTANAEIDYAAMLREATAKAKQETTAEPEQKTLAQEQKAETVHPYKANVEKIAAAIKQGNYTSVKSLFTDEGYDVYNRLVNYGKARIISTPELKFDTLENYIYARSIPMQFTFSQNRKFSENVVFVFDTDGKIDNVQFGLSQIAEGDILSNPQWSEVARLVLRNFMENYKTAYALKRIDYLDQIFADDALIITGKVVYKKEGDSENGWKNNRYVELTKQDKQTYIKNLRRVFQGQEFINLKFANNDIIRMGQAGEVYAIQIKQDYFSASYGDSGYLFLLVDVNNPNEPIIHVRAWQEEPDPTWGIIGPENF